MVRTSQDSFRFAFAFIVISHPFPISTKMKYIGFFFLLWFANFTALAQIKYAAKIELGHTNWLFRTVRVDPGPNWKGYNLEEHVNGKEISVINGLAINEKLYTGIGVGYLNFEGIHGFSSFVDVQYVATKSKVSPYVNLKMGYNHIWNQYENGTGSGLGEIGVGINVKLSPKLQLYGQSGFLATQQCMLIPLRIGVRL